MIIDPHPTPGSGVLPPPERKAQSESSSSAYQYVDVPTKYLGDTPESGVFAVLPIPTGDRSKPHARAAWLTTRATYAHYLPFLHSLTPLPEIERKYTIRPSPIGGLGVFATQDIARYETILVERPFFFYPRDMDFEVPIAEWLTMEDVVRRAARSKTWGREIMEERAEATMKKVFEYCLTKDEQTQYLSHANAHPANGDVCGRIRTNAYGVPKIQGQTAKDMECGYSGMFRDGSRFNHSCRPDAFLIWDSTRWALHFYALRPIKAGSEITVKYCEPLATLAERRYSCDRYLFQCTCTICRNSTPAGDKLRQNLPAMVNQWKQDPTLPNKMPLLQALKKRMEEEGLDTPNTGYYLLLKLIYSLWVFEERPDMAAEIQAIYPPNIEGICRE